MMEEGGLGNHIDNDHDDVSEDSADETAGDVNICGVTREPEHDDEQPTDVDAPPAKKSRVELPRREGLTFRPSNCLDLTMHVFETSFTPQLSKSELAKRAHRLHVELGGTRHPKPANMMRNILEILTHKGKVQRCPNNSGRWELVATTNADKDVSETVTTNQENPNESTDIGKNNPSVESLSSSRILEIIGYGKHAIYLCYNPAIKEVADLNKESTWECRIGSVNTSKKLSTAIISQTKSFFTDCDPVIGLVILDDEALVLDDIIQRYLIYGKMEVKDKKRCFQCNPAIMMKIYNSLKSEI
jgi:hypothetical protein